MEFALNTITDIHYGGDGHWGRAGVDSPDDPYWGGGRTPRSLALRQSSLNELKWMCDGQPHHFVADTSLQVAWLPGRSYLLIGLQYCSRAFPPPGNALVLRADGSLDHVLSPPPQVVPNPVNLDETPPHFSASGPGSRLCGESFNAGRSFAAEGFGTVGCHEGQLFADIIFHYEWRERRLYDPESVTGSGLKSVGKT